MHDITMCTKDSPRQCVAKKLGGGIEFDTGLIGKNPLETSCSSGSFHSDFFVQGGSGQKAPNSG